MGERLVVGRCGVKIIHLKLLPSHFNDVSFSMTARRLEVKYANWTLNDLVSFIAIGIEQNGDMAEHVWKQVQVKPKQTPNQNEHRSNVIFDAAFASPIANQEQ